MQIPATGFRRVMISCLNEPPRNKPISGFLELAAKLVYDTGPTLFCFEDEGEVSALLDIYGIVFYITVVKGLLGLTEITKTDYAIQHFCKVINLKLRYVDCKEYVQKGKGVFFGIKKRIRAAVEDESKVSWNQFNRLDNLPRIAYVELDCPLQKPLSRSLLRVFESQIESHAGAAQYVSHKKRFSERNQQIISPYAIDDLWAFIQLWLSGILMASIVFLLQCVVSHSQETLLRFFQHYYFIFSVLRVKTYVQTIV